MTPPPSTSQSRPSGLAGGCNNAGLRALMRYQRRRLLRVERPDLVADPKVADGRVVSREVQVEVDLVPVEHAEAGRDHHLLIADPLEAGWNHVMAVDADPA